MNDEDLGDRLDRLEKMQKQIIVEQKSLKNLIKKHLIEKIDTIYGFITLLIIFCVLYTFIGFFIDIAKVLR